MIHYRNDAKVSAASKNDVTTLTAEERAERKSAWVALTNRRYYKPQKQPKRKLIPPPPPKPTYTEKLEAAIQRAKGGAL